MQLVLASILTLNYVSNQSIFSMNPFPPTGYIFPLNFILFYNITKFLPYTGKDSLKFKNNSLPKILKKNLRRIFSGKCIGQFKGNFNLQQYLSIIQLSIPFFFFFCFQFEK